MGFDMEAQRASSKFLRRLMAYTDVIISFSTNPVTRLGPLPSSCQSLGADARRPFLPLGFP